MVVKYDVIVVGGGHAGLEAACAAARMGASTCLITMNKENVVGISCNPSIGGLGKSQIVAEVAAMGGVMPKIADMSALQYKILNKSKGFAVWSLRAQIDRNGYTKHASRLAQQTPNLEVCEDLVVDLEVSGGKVRGVVGQKGPKYKAKSIVICTGTFLGGTIYLGMEQRLAGRLGEGSALELSKSIRRHGFNLGRFKTGTPPRVSKSSLNFERMKPEPGDDDKTLSFSGDPSLCKNPRQACYVTYTNAKTHALLLRHKNKSPLYAGEIEGIGPRYCPSIEDKVVRFADRDRHQIYLEPESLETDEWYVNGLSTCMPPEVQELFVRTCSGLEEVEIVKPGYAVEYDFIDPRHLKPTLETSLIDGLFFAGQVNGTSGYEEAAGQGLLAGTNAALNAKDIKIGRGKKAIDKTTFELNRHRSYIGVMVDDLVLKGVLEPYRMFTSRAENRLGLRVDNADLRLTKKAFEVGLVGEDEHNNLLNKEKELEEWKIQAKVVQIGVDLANEDPNADPKEPRPQIEPPSSFAGKTLLAVLGSPEFSFQEVVELCVDDYGISESVATSLVAEAKYAGYIAKQKRTWARLQGKWGVPLPSNLNYKSILGMRKEAIERLERVRPTTLESAFRIPGLTPVDVNLIWLHLGYKLDYKVPNRSKLVRVVRDANQRHVT